MRIPTFFILISLFISNQTKAADITLELKVDSVSQGIDFTCLKVIDARFNKDNIGLITRGLKKNDTKILFPSEFDSYIKQTIDKMLPKNANKIELVLIFRDLIVSENIGTMNQYAYCNVEIEFARQVDTLLYSLGTFHSSIVEKGNKVKYSHENRVFQALDDCLKKFNQSNWNTTEGILLGNFDQEIVFDYKSLPKKGIYLNFEQLLRKSPISDVDFEIKELKESNKFISYTIDFKEQINQELVQFVSDGTAIYMHANANQYLKSGSYGKYIYFQGKFPTSSNSDETIFLAGVSSLAGGLVGGLFFAIAADVSNANNTIKGVVLNTEKGIIKPLTDYYLVEIARDFPELLKEYRASKRGLADKGNLINKLNSKY